MLASHIRALLLIAGVITALPILQFLFPALALRLLYKLDLRDEAGLFFARHWGLLAACFGGLLVFASGHAEAREPIVIAAMLEKAGLVGTIAADWKKLHTRGMRLVAAFDTACVAVFGAWLLGF
ncbi:MAG: hypothetical protein ACM3PC_03675 [Deltaproteobacteria bacterium]